jgi:hypothetical protein
VGENIHKSLFAKFQHQQNIPEGKRKKCRSTEEEIAKKSLDAESVIYEDGSDSCCVRENSACLLSFIYDEK